MAEDKKHRVPETVLVRSNSPGPLIGGEQGAIDVAEMPMPDNISVASYQNYDISSDESLQNVRVKIRIAGKWNRELETKWRQYQEEEAKSVLKPISYAD